MKLRNRKTGDIVEDSDLGKMLSQYEMPSFESISDLCEEWEDYKPTEPLIKDPKIRKAVRAWAEAHKARTIVARKDFAYFEFEGYSIEFPTTEPSDYIEFYPIAELCGEEEE